MSFDAKRDIEIEGSESADGTYSFRTKGLASWNRSELEIGGVPESLFSAAGILLTNTADYAVAQLEAIGGQSIEIGLIHAEDDIPLLLAMRAEAVAPSGGGLWSKLFGGGDGRSIRLVDIDAVPGSSAPARTALTTAQLYRVVGRRNNGDIDGAREAALAAVRFFPGAITSDAGSPPDVALGEWVYNWQNHRAWLALAELEDSAEHYAEALRRSHVLAREELGATLEEIAQAEPATLRAVADRIIEENLTTASEIMSGSTAATVLASPVWEVSADGSTTFRRASIAPASFRRLYFEGAAAEGLRQYGARLASDAIIAVRAAPWATAWRFRALRSVWTHRNAPAFPATKPRPAVGLVSTLLVAIGRAFHAGGSPEEIGHYLAGKPTERLEKALLELGTWEHEQYERALGIA